jgi:membrane protein DedA with SNARE-associated domain
VRLATSLALTGFALLAAAGAPTPAEGILLASGAGAGGVPVPLALLAAWAGYSAGDALSFALLRGGLYCRLPRRWRRRIESTPVRRVGPRTVFLSRLLPGSAVVNALAAASPLSPRRFIVAAALGEALFASAVLGVGAGGAALVERSLFGALAAAVAVGAAVLVRRWRRARVRPRGGVAAAGAR